MASFLAMTSPKEAKKIVDADFSFFAFFRIFGTFLGEKSRFLEILGKNGPKIRKNAKNEKSATNYFFDLLLASHSQKTGHQGSNMEN